MSNIMDLVKETLALTRSVGELKSETTRLAKKVDDHADRIIKLEMREELLQEKSTNRAIGAVNEMNEKIFERITKLEYFTGMKKIPPSGDDRQNSS
uniref:Uncharacterized protein n=1 Tax=Candidatus Kentrum sp. TC TaxID=2126339 RepID=A0A450ZTH9_9GAMM|nr:MAG: hypothetical protein BECKTC1821D_GA0114238_104513 [Candidatus Kentron sp. TC]VFK57083.1 MAG: hypothetical protein BECKTC1821F_GA0114240_101444 [Candidatus Kentron sp. TC]